MPGRSSPEPPAAGQAAPAAPGALDELLPRYDTAERHRRLVAASRRPGFVKAAMSFRVSARDGGTLVETETRALATDPVSRRRFLRYWRLIRLGSGAIRRSWLRAVDRRRPERAR